MDQLDRAHDIRKFEIELYWRRATYFWTFIAAAFVAFFGVRWAEGLGREDKQILSFVVSNLGLVFSFGWFLINRGSKFWQQNWEIQVDRLENQSSESLYRLVAYKDKNNCWLVDPESYSVSKINQMTSFYVALIWFGLWAWQLSVQVGLSITYDHIGGILIVFAFVSIAFCISFHCEGKTEIEETDYCYAYRLVRRTPIRLL